MYNKPVRQSLKTRKWYKFRDKVMRQHDYLCQESLRYGQSVPAEMVHHIYPVSEYPELEYVSWNCLPLTNRKHNTFHDRNNDKIIGNGIYWQKKRKKEFLNFFKNKNEKWKKFFIPPTSKKIFRSLWEPVKGTFSKSGAFKQKGGKN